MATVNGARAGESGPGERLLVVDDEADIADLLVTGLRFVGFDVRAAHNGTDALAIAAEFRPHLLLLDVMLPDIDGFELCRQLRVAREPTGVIFLTARDRAADTLTGLRIGGDDYISKPFSLDEVVARVGAVLRRVAPVNGSMAGSEPGVLRFADLELDQDAHEVRRANIVIDLSATEFSLLRYLMENRNHVVSKRQILAHVWSYDYHGGDGVVESYISALRKKVDRFEPRLIHTVRGIGYSMRVRAHDAEAAR